MSLLPYSMLLCLIVVTKASSESDCCDQQCCPKTWLGYNGFCYRYFTYLKTWAEARTFCQTIGADLVSIHSEDENNIVSGLVGGKKVWIGLSDLETEGQFIWTDGTSYSYTNWSPNNPSNGGHGAEDCGEINWPNIGDLQWNDKECDAVRGFVCKL